MMNKFLKTIKKIFKVISKFIDKKIVLPITKIFVWLSKKINFNGKNFERVITRKPGIIILSLVIAYIVFLVADTRSTSLIETSAEVLYDQKITASYNEGAYVIEGLPETVDITLIGRKSDVYLAKQLPTNDITIDLNGLEPGVHKVNLKYKKALSSVEYKLDPSVATIVIYKKDTEKMEVNYEIINKNKVDSKYMVEDIVLSDEIVKIRGNEATLKEVSSVKAFIDLNNLKKNDNKELDLGKQTLSNVKLVAYDSDGNKVDVETVPSKISAEVTITSPQKEVPIKVIPKNYNEIVWGKAISNITSDVNKVVIYGDKEKIEKISYIPVYVDMNALKEDKKFTLPIEKPSGVRLISHSTINVNVTLGEEEDKEFSDVYLEYENLKDGLKVQAINAESTKVTVIVKGVKNLLDKLDPASIKAYIDLEEITEPGDYNIKVKVSGNDLKLKYEPKTIEIPLRITKK